MFKLAHRETQKLDGTVKIGSLKYNAPLPYVQGGFQKPRGGYALPWAPKRPHSQGKEVHAGVHNPVRGLQKE